MKPNDHRVVVAFSPDWDYLIQMSLLSLRQKSPPRVAELRDRPNTASRGRLPNDLFAVENLSTWAGAIPLTVAVTALVGWAIDVDVLKSIIPGASTMKANTAICFLLMGAGIVLLSRSVRHPKRLVIGLALVAGSSLLAFATFLEYTTGASLGIDQLLFTETPGEIGAAVAGRMSPVSAISFALVGVAAVSAVTVRGGGRLVSVLCGLVLAMAALNTVNFVFDVGVPPFLAGYTQIAINTAAAMGILSIGVLGLLGRANPLIVLGGGSPTSKLLRDLVALFLVAPLALTWLRLEGQHLGLFDASYGASIMVVAIMFLGLVTVLRSGRLTRDSEDARAALELERDRFFNLSLDMLSVTTVDGRFVRVNGAWETTLGYRPDDLIGTRAIDLVHPDDLERTLDTARRHHGEGEKLVGFNNRYRHRDGTYRWLEWMSQTAPDGGLSFGVARDITDRRLDEERAERLQRTLELRNLTLTERVIRDPLTGLHNRRFFDEAIAALEERRSQKPSERDRISIIIFDLDHFGDVNKRHGHQAGDAVLRHFGALLAKRFRSSDLVARYGGEEFVAVLQGARSADATRIAESVRTGLEAKAIDIGNGNSIRVSVSAGCTELDDEDTIAAGLAVADVWLSQAKRAGRNQVLGSVAMRPRAPRSTATPGPVTGRQRSRG
jgi:diguanylate cyclase (GGDEF)-like protein/PAS domain S-box-containing protein